MLTDHHLFKNLDIEDHLDDLSIELEKELLLNPDDTILKYYTTLDFLKYIEEDDIF